VSESHRPRRVPSSTFSRPGLMSRLDAAADIVVLHGPAGAGKTTLLASWAERAGQPMIWLDAASAEPSSSGTAEAAAGAGPGRQEGGSASFLRDPSWPASSWPEPAEGQRRLLVVDHAERLEADALARLGALVDEDPGLRLVVATRSSAVVRALGLSTDAAIDVIGPEDLLVDDAELASAAPGLRPSERALILEASAGLAVAVRAELEGAERLRERFRARLLAEADARDPQLRETVARLALVSEVDAAVLEAWGMDPGLPALAEELGLGSSRAGWFALSPFARQAVQQLAEQIPAAERERLLRGAVHASLADSRPVEALRLALEMHDLELATEIAFARWVELVERRGETLKVLSAVRVSAMTRYPALIVLYAMIANMERATRRRALELFAATSALMRLQPGRGSRRDRVVYRAFEASAIRLTPAADTAVALARRAVADLESLPDAEFESMGRIGPLLYSHLGITAMYAGDDALAARCFELGYAKHAEAGRLDAVEQLSARGALAASTGDLPLARRLLAQADAARWPEGWRRGNAGELLELGLAILALEDGDTARAQAHLDAVGPIVDLAEHWPLFTAAQALTDALSGDAAGGLARVERVRMERGSSPTTSRARGLVEAAEAGLLLAAGNVQGARQLAARAARNAPEGTLALARVQLAVGSRGEAVAALDRLLARQSRSIRVALEAELLLAAILLRDRQRGDGDAVMARAGDRLLATGMRVPLAVIEGSDRELLRASAERLHRPDLAAILSEARTIAPEAALPAPVLTPREQVVLRALAESPSVAVIAERLFVTPNTVKTQLRSVYRKLGVRSRQEALLRASALGYLSSPDSPRPGPR